MVLGETPETYGKDIDNNFLIKNTMEEKKKLAEKIAGQPQKYSYEQLTQIASELSIQNQKLVEKLKKYLPESAYAEKTDNTALNAERKDAEAPLPADDEIMEFYPEDPDENSGELNDGSAYDKEKLTNAGVDVVSGLGYSGNDEEFYGEMLDEFASSFEGKIAALDGFLAAENWKDYNVKVHAMKSNARMIGAESLSVQALKLEEASKKEDTAYVRENHVLLAESGRKLVEAINESLGR